MKLKVYQYERCGTCRKAVRWLKEHGHDLTLVSIIEEPPSAEELADLIDKSGLDARKFFNTSGQAYKESGLKDKIPDMSREDMIRLLAGNGRLIKRPIVTDGKDVTVGFREDQFEAVWNR